MGEVTGTSSQMTETTMPYSPHLHDSDQPSVRTPNFSKVSDTNFTAAADEDDGYFAQRGAGFGTALPSPSHGSQAAGHESDCELERAGGQYSAADADQGNANERPLSQLILAVQGTDAELMKQIAPGVSVHVKRFVKVPMISQLSLAGI